MHVTGRTFLITGGGSGLGAACARRFTQRGGNVVLLDTDEPAVHEVAEQLGDRAVMVVGDVTSPDDVQTALSAARERFAHLGGAVNCAGVLGAARVVGREGPHPLDLFERVVRVNLVGTFNVCRLVAEALKDAPVDDEGERGVLINTSSVAAFEGQIGQAAYSASKGGVAAMTLPLARDLARYGIRVAAIAPGVFETAMMQATPDVLRQSLESQTIFPPRFGQPGEFAALAEHIVENSMLNGAVLRLDGALRLAAR